MRVILASLACYRGMIKSGGSGQCRILSSSDMQMLCFVYRWVGFSGLQGLAVGEDPLGLELWKNDQK